MKRVLRGFSTTEHNKKEPSGNNGSLFRALKAERGFLETQDGTSSKGEAGSLGRRGTRGSGGSPVYPATRGYRGRTVYRDTREQRELRGRAVHQEIRFGQLFSIILVKSLHIFIRCRYLLSISNFV